LLALLLGETPRSELKKAMINTKFQFGRRSFPSHYLCRQ